MLFDRRHAAVQGDAPEVFVEEAHDPGRNVAREDRQ